MKNYFFLFFLIFSSAAFSQIELGSKSTSGPKPIKAEVLERFKQSTTLFVLPDYVSTESYNALLKEIWTVTPYKVIAYEDYDIQELYDENYSFFTIDFHKKNKKNKTGNGYTAFYTYFDLSVYNGPVIESRLSKFDDRVKGKKLPIILEKNKTSLAKFHLYTEEAFVKNALKFKRDATLQGLYANDIFYNYSEGMLKNYLQKMHSLILKGNDYVLELKDHNSSKLSALTSKTLYIPDYITLKTNINKSKIAQMKDKEIEKLFEFYNYSYEVISKEALSEAIIKKEELFYLRYVRVDDQKFLQVVNAATGETIFRDYIPGVGFNLKPKNFEYLSHLIDPSKNQLEK